MLTLYFGHQLCLSLFNNTEMRNSTSNAMNPPTLPSRNQQVYRLKFYRLIVKTKRHWCVQPLLKQSCLSPYIESYYSYNFIIKLISLEFDLDKFYDIEIFHSHNSIPVDQDLVKTVFFKYNKTK